MSSSKWTESEGLLRHSRQRQRFGTGEHAYDMWKGIPVVLGKSVPGDSTALGLWHVLACRQAVLTGMGCGKWCSPMPAFLHVPLPASLFSPSFPWHLPCPLPCLRGASALNSPAHCARQGQAAFKVPSNLLCTKLVAFSQTIFLHAAVI